MSLPLLMDRNAVARHLFGCEKASECRRSVDAVFRMVPNVVLPEFGKPFVRGADVQGLLDDAVVDWPDGRVA